MKKENANQEKQRQKELELKRGWEIGDNFGLLNLDEKKLFSRNNIVKKLATTNCLVNYIWIRIVLTEQSLTARNFYFCLRYYLAFLFHF